MRSRCFAIAATLLLLSCAGARTFINEDADWAFYQKVGVLPFVNLSPDRFAGEKFQSAFVTELLLARKFQVVEPGEFNLKAAEALKGSATIGKEFSLDQIKAIGDKTGVQGVIEGVIKEYSMVRVGQADYPLISIEVKMIDASTGAVVWMTSYTKKGGPKFPIISLGETHTLSELTQKACHDVISNFISKAY
ncbi:MAG: hypothetical protein CO189_07630 [candidate division Zixibacteria bacterium CG_4_9_14_3_um_filter_46_8]|nr:MAG: hypothetical protein CO189_07630 [candidate division Zixibacteria bacterium CG_4_9_14_3_um_filter_46_8]